MTDKRITQAAAMGSAIYAEVFEKAQARLRHVHHFNMADVQEDAGYSAIKLRWDWIRQWLERDYAVQREDGQAVGVLSTGSTESVNPLEPLAGEFFKLKAQKLAKAMRTAENDGTNHTASVALVMLSESIVPDPEHRDGERAAPLKRGHRYVSQVFAIGRGKRAEGYCDRYFMDADFSRFGAEIHKRSAIGKLKQHDVRVDDAERILSAPEVQKLLEAR